jgi:hypothetical protein
MEWARLRLGNGAGRYRSIDGSRCAGDVNHDAGRQPVRIDRNADSQPFPKMASRTGATWSSAPRCREPCGAPQLAVVRLLRNSSGPVLLAEADGRYASTAGGEAIKAVRQWHESVFV